MTSTPRSTSGRRDRQMVEIAALVAEGRRERAAGLALEHTAEFPGDGELLAGMIGAGR